jgi:serine/threonine protein kinase
MTDAGILSGTLPRPFGKYTLIRELGRGAMGMVYEARDSALDRRVALKLMLPSDNPDPKDAMTEEQLFTREAQLCARLAKHPNIVSVYEAGAIEGRRFIAMEYIDGTPLSEWTKQRQPSLRSRIRRAAPSSPTSGWPSASAGAKDPPSPAARRRRLARAWSSAPQHT